MTTLRPLIARAFASLVAAGLVLVSSTGALAAPAAPRDDAGRLTRDIAGLSVQVVGDVPATASVKTPYGVVIEALSTLRDLADVTVSISVTDTPFATVGELDEFVASPGSTPVRQVAMTPVNAMSLQPTGQLAVGVRTATSVVVPAGGLGISADAPGVYGVVVTVKVGADTVWLRAAPLTWEPASLPQLRVAAVASILGTEERVASLLLAASDKRVSLLVDPTALTQAQRRALVGRDAYALPAANLDITSAAHAETPALVTEAIARTRAVSDLPWIAVGAAADDLTVATATAEGAAAVLVDPRWSSLAAPAGGGAIDAGQIGDVPTVPVVIADHGLSTMLASRSPADSTTSAWVVARAAYEAMAGAGTVVVAPGETWGVVDTRPSRTLGALLDAPFVEPITLDEVLTAPERHAVDLPDALALLSDAPAEEVVAAVSALTFLEALATATASPSTMITDAERGILEALSLQNRADPNYRAEQVAAAAATANAVLGSVSVTSGSQLLLVSSSGSVPITVRNSLDVPVTVRVAVTSRSPILQTKVNPVATIEPGAETTVTVPMKAISSGDVNVSVALRSEEGATLAVAETLKVRVRAAWGNLATGLFTGGLVVLLIAGVIRTIRRGRKDTRLMPSDDMPVAGASSADL